MSFQDFEILEDEEETERRGARNEKDSLWIRVGSGVCVGFLLGYSSVVLQDLRPLIQSELRLSCSALESLLSLFPLSLVATPFFVGPLFPSKGHLAVSKIPFLLFPIIFLLSAGFSSISTDSSYAIYLGQLLCGISVAGNVLMHLPYLAQSSYSKDRGKSCGSLGIGVSSGILFAYLMDFIFSSTPSGYKYVLSIIPVAVDVLLILLILIRGKNAYRPIEESSTHTYPFPWILCGGILLLQHFAGQPNVLIYAREIFKRLGFCDGVQESFASLGLGLMQLLGSGVAFLSVDRFGRKVVFVLGALFTGAAGILLSVESFNRGQIWSPPPCRDNFTLSFEYIPDTCEHESARDFEAIMLGGLAVYIFSFSASFGTISWIILSEIGSVMSKPLLFIGYMLSVNWTGKYFAYEAFYKEILMFKMGGIFLCYSLTCIFSALYIFVLLPETVNKELHEISLNVQKSAMGKSSSRSHSSSSYTMIQNN